MNLNLTILSSKLWKNTYFESILSIAFADKAIVCFIIAIFSRVYNVKTRFDVEQKMCSNKYSFSVTITSNHNIHYKFVQ